MKNKECKRSQEKIETEDFNSLLPKKTPPIHPTEHRANNNIRTYFNPQFPGWIMASTPHYRELNSKISLHKPKKDTIAA